MSDLRPVFLADLTHTAQVIGSEFMPYAVASIGAYLMAHSKHASQLEIEVFKFPGDLIEALAARKPFVLALSNFIWNANLAVEIARRAKLKYPDLIVVFGGCNFPEEPEAQEQWHRQRPWVDFYIRLEGEVAFRDLIDALIDHDGDKLCAANLDIGNTSHILLGEFRAAESLRRIQNLDEIPSPYLTGILDQYFETSLWPLVETNRGCPFSCAFCTEGYTYYNKIAKRSNGAVVDELTYIAQHHKKQNMVFFADSNFLMYKENLAICDVLASLQTQYKWPSFIGCSTGKNRQDIVLQGVSKLKDTITTCAAVQSLDPDVLKNVRRSNISPAALFDIALKSQGSGAPTYSEVIACLPGDTLEKFKETVRQLVHSGITTIKTHTLLLLQGTELQTNAARERFGFKTAFRPVTKSFGRYDFMSEKFLSVEHEEIVIATDTLTFEDYLECRRLQVTLHTFYNDDLFCELHQFLSALGIDIWEWLLYIHESIDCSHPGTRALYDSYMHDVRSELFTSLDELWEDVDANLDQYLAGDRGSNVTFKHKALLFDRFAPDILRTGFDAALSLIERAGLPNQEVNRDFLEDLLNLSMSRKIDLFSWEAEFDVVTNFLPLSTSEGEQVPKRRGTPLLLHVTHSREQKDFLSKYFATHARDNIIELAWLLNRVPASNLYRQTEKAAQ